MPGTAPFGLACREKKMQRNPFVFARRQLELIPEKPYSFFDPTPATGTCGLSANHVYVPYFRALVSFCESALSSGRSPVEGMRRDADGERRFEERLCDAHFSPCFPGTSLEPGSGPMTGGSLSTPPRHYPKPPSPLVLPLQNHGPPITACDILPRVAMVWAKTIEPSVRRVAWRLGPATPPSTHIFQQMAR